MTDARLRPDERLKRKGDFERAYRHGRRFTDAFFIAYVLPREQGRLRLGVVASRRVGGSVRRNRAKRLLREVFRKNKPAADVSADVVLIAKGALAGASYRDLEPRYVKTVGRALRASSLKN